MSAPVVKVTEVIGGVGGDGPYLMGDGDEPDVRMRDLMPSEAVGAFGRFKITVEFVPDPEEEDQ